MGYIEVVVEPLLQTWVEFLPNVCKQDLIIKGLEENKKLIALKIEETKALGAIHGQNHTDGHSDDMDVDD